MHQHGADQRGLALHTMMVPQMIAVQARKLRTGALPFHPQAAAQHVQQAVDAARGRDEHRRRAERPAVLVYLHVDYLAVAHMGRKGYDGIAQNVTVSASASAAAARFRALSCWFCSEVPQYKLSKVLLKLSSSLWHPTMSTGRSPTNVSSTR